MAAPGSELQFKYDVGFSFLTVDRPFVLQLNERLKNRLATFVFDEHQEKIAGRDGETFFARVFGSEARIIVLCYRPGWGEQGFTVAESTAIRNRIFDHGHEFLTVLPTCTPPVVPPWVPKNRIWARPDLGFDSLATIIESRVVEWGGQPRAESAAERVERARRELADRSERTSFLESQNGVAAVYNQFNVLCTICRRLSQESSGFLGRPRVERNFVELSCGYRVARFVLDVPVSNSAPAAVLRLIEEDRSRDEFVNKSSPRWSRKFGFALGSNREHGWSEGEKFFTSQALVDDVANALIARRMDDDLRERR